MTKYCLGIASAFMVVAGANAAPPEDAPAPATTSGAAALEEIVVTAQRREENLQHAAIAVTAVAGDRLGEAGAIKVQDLTQIVPSLQVAVAAGPYPLFYLRGVGNFNGNPLSDSAVALNLDGVYIARPSSTAGLFYDLNRVEVLKGPQGTLYGRNATGGAINVITNKPSTDEISGEASVEFGNFRTKNFNGAINIPLSSSLAVRLAGQSTDHAGYLSDGSDDDKGRAGRLEVLYTPTESLTINTTGDYYHQGGRGAGATVLQPGIGFIDGNPRVGNTSPAANALYSSTFYFLAGDTFGPLTDKALFEANLPVGIHQNNDYWGIGTTIDWKSDLGILTVVPAYRQSTLNFTSTAAGFLIDQQERDKQGSFEARFASNTDQLLTYLAGFYYLNESVSAHLLYDQQFNASAQDFDLSTKSYAGFGRLQYAITDAVRVTAGVRYTDDKKSMHGTFVSAGIQCPGSFIPPPAGPQFCFGGVGQVTVPTPTINQQAAASFSDTTWRAGVEWDVTSASLLYGAVETGFKAGGFYFTHDDPAYRPEKITAYSIGSKNRFMDNRLQVNGELFYWVYKDQQISHLGSDSTGTIIFPTDNVGSAKMKGFELESQLSLATNTLLMTDIEYLDAVYSDYRYLTPNFGAPPVTACPYATLGAQYQVNCSGNVPPQSPKWSVNLGLQQTVPVGTGSLVANLTTHFQTQSLTGLEFSAIEEQHSYWMSNADLGYHAAKDHWAVVGFVENLADKTVVNGTFAQPLAGAALTAATLRPPRTYGVRLSVKF